jgi:hypothetical protein
MTAQARKAIFYAAKHTLRHKVGIGGIDPALIERAEQHIVRNDFDYTPIATTVCDRLRDAVADVENQQLKGNIATARIITPIMELKAHGAMFGYPLISNISQIALIFLENINVMQGDALQIVKLHLTCLNLILAGRIRDVSSREGQTLIAELQAACNRYNKKHNVGAA